jgi:hypothetical protein
MRNKLENILIVLSFLQILCQIGILQISSHHLINLPILIAILPAMNHNGLRICQIFHLFPSVLISVTSMFTTTNQFTLIAGNSLGLLIALSLRYFYGPGDFSRVEIRGNYEVGCGTFHLSKGGNAVSFFYPIDRSIDKTKYQKKKWVDYCKNKIQMKKLINALNWADGYAVQYPNWVV